MRNYLILFLASLFLCSCGEYQRVLKSDDVNYKFDYAKRAYEEGRYVQAATLLKDCITLLKGSDKAEESLYLLAMSHFENKDYVSSGAYFSTYYNRYPRGRYTEAARFYCGYGYFLDSPEPQLDQTGTIKAIEELQAFLDYFPRSEKVSIAQNAIFELQDKLTLKQLQNAAVIVAKNAIKDYPYSKYKEDLEMLILKARYQEAVNSIEERKAERFREVVDEYYSFINNYPDTDNRQEADNIFRIASRYAAE